jgi:hypothetical protein
LTVLEHPMNHTHRSPRCCAGVAWLLLAGSVALGGVDQEVRRCAAVEDETRRLECYDALARDLPPAGPDGRASDWKLDTVEDGAAVELTLAADREVKGQDRTFRPLLVLSCRDGVLHALVRTGMATQAEKDGDKTVMLQLGDEPPFADKMTDAEEGLALSFSSAEMLAGQLLRHRSLQFQFMPRFSKHASVRFATGGLDRAIQPILDACKLRVADDGFLVPR